MQMGAHSHAPASTPADDDDESAEAVAADRCWFHQYGQRLFSCYYEGSVFLLRRTQSKTGVISTKEKIRNIILIII